MSLTARLREAIRRCGAAGAVAGVSVRGQREVGAAWRDGSPGLTSDTRLHIASVTKPILATAAVRLWQRRGIALDAPVVDLVGELSVDWRASRRITLRHLLSHTSGLRTDIPAEELALDGDAPDALARAVRRTVHHGQTFRVGAAWQYCNAGYGLAGFALGAVSGAAFEETLRDELLLAAGMHRSSFDPPDVVGRSNGQPVRDRYWPARRPGGGLVSTVDDVLSFAEFAMDDPSFETTGVAISPSLFGSRYALGWNIAHRGRVRWAFGDWGGCHSALLVVPDQRVAVAVVVPDDAGDDARGNIGWAEVARLTGRGRPRLAPGIHFVHAGARSLLARTATLGR
jgi:CubicO group peptidase (beta-lactamase class C family)